MPTNSAGYLLLRIAWILVLGQLVAGAPSFDYALTKRDRSDRERVRMLPWMSMWRGRVVVPGKLDPDWEPENKHDAEGIKAKLKEFAQWGYLSIVEEHGGHNIDLVAALYVPGNGVWLSSMPSGPGAQYILDRKIAAPSWEDMAGRVAGKADDFGAEDGAIFYCEQRLKARGQELRRRDNQLRGFPDGTHLVVHGRSTLEDDHGPLPPCLHHNLQTTPSCLESIGRLNILFSDAPRPAPDRVALRPRAAPKKDKTCRNQCKKCAPNEIQNNNCKSCKACPKGQKPDAKKKKCIPEQKECKKCAKNEIQAADCKSCKACPKGQVPDGTKKKCIPKPKGCKICGKNEIDSDDCMSCKACPKGKKPNSSRNICIPDNAAQKKKEAQFQEMKKKKIKEARKKKKEARFQKMKKKKIADFKRTELKNRKKARMGKCLTIVPIMMIGDSLNWVSSFFDEKFLESDTMMVHWPADLPKPVGNIDSDEYITEWIALAIQLDEVRQEACPNNAKHMCIRSLSDSAMSEKRSNETISVIRDLMARGTEGDNEPHQHKKRVFWFISLILNFVRSAVTSFLRLGASAVRIGGRFGKLLKKGDNAFKIAQKATGRGRKGNKGANIDDMKNAAKKIAGNHNWKKCLTGKKPG
ncbi:hypothetical protein AJ80_00284 [Polytolypa hystricis UAMH7299]|uniref:Uncharacterized protein n=1 Tax=Polytolypa hystricis (strain UAMH7299) TaxID=1447883 RepID=A0A2B7Z461_POLH7|nr:hypothetical protein AJ80_00284 [Polytolypa hystricis UAMH7299]